ncbi:MAG: hypothetical protein INQ03_14775 [Candidatus Heimdallarchaeota archaeon]|nr:hypothetical protein [Candidatus Heimdallarchaeota archaeon]
MVEVHKFGGSCFISPSSYANVVRIIEETDRDLICVVSAAYGVTDQLRKYIQSSRSSFAQQMLLDVLMGIHSSVLPKSICVQADQLIHQFICTIEDKTDDEILAFGEQVNSILISSLIVESLCINPIDYLIVEPESRLLRSTHRGYELLSNIFQNTSVLIMPGFYGYTDEGELLTLGRSGTDYSASFMAMLAKAKSITIWKDVNGVLTADPKFVNAAITIPEISYDELEILSRNGCDVIHPDAIAPVRDACIPIIIRNFNNPEFFTLVTSKSARLLHNISLKHDQRLIKIRHHNDQIDQELIIDATTTPIDVLHPSYDPSIKSYSKVSTLFVVSSKNTMQMIHKSSLPILQMNISEKSCNIVVKQKHLQYVTNEVHSLFESKDLN